MNVREFQTHKDVIKTGKQNQALTNSKLHIN